MHSYLTSIGFKHITKEKLDQLIYQIEKQPDAYEAAIDSESNEYAELRYQVSNNMGIAIRGVYDENDSFQLDYYYPYYIADQLSTSEDVDIIKQSDKECYQGICDEVKLGVNLIFYLQNMMMYLQTPHKNRKAMHVGGTYLSGLSLSGKILLPIYKSEKQMQKTKKTGNDRNMLVAAARDGDEDAIENLTIEDMDTYSMISKRIQNEDVLSIVNSYFMPYGIESDKYTILGEIQDVKKVTNQISMEDVYIMDINSNELCFTVCINEEDLLGEPMVGRRFKGDVWMQGSINII